MSDDEKGNGGLNGQTSSSHSGEIQEQKHQSTITLKLPTFWTRYPDAWFRIAESHFSLNKIKADHKKVHYVLTALTENIVASIIYLIRTPECHTYDALKAKLIERYTMSEQKRLDSLLRDSEMGDQKPSDFYRQLETTCGSSDMVNDTLIKRIWMNRLPKTISIALMSAAKEDIQDLLKLADEIWEASNGPNVSAVTASNENATSTHLLKVVTDMMQKMQTMEQEIHHINERSMTNRGRYRTRTRSPSFLSQRGRSFSSRSNSRSGICFYHRKFGNQAHSCRKPCSFSDKDSENFPKNN